MAKLVYTDQGEELEFILDTGRASITIGRNPMCDLRINNPSISRKHAEIRVDAATGAFSIYDLNSSNGTYVNGKRESSAPLGHGDELLCGEFKLLFYTEDAAADDGPYTPSDALMEDEGPVDVISTGGVAPYEDEPEPIHRATEAGVPVGGEPRFGGTPKAGPSPLLERDNEIENLRAELDSVRTALENANSRAQIAEGDAQNLRAEIDRLTEQNAELQEALGDLSAELGALVEANETLLAQVGAAE